MELFTRSDWQAAYERFSQIHQKLAEYEYNFTTGSNKAIRAKADREIQHQIQVLRRTFGTYPQIDNIAFGVQSERDVYKEKEFFEIRYVVNDLRDLLDQIEERIESL